MITQGLSIPFMILLGFVPVFGISAGAYFVRMALTKAVLGDRSVEPGLHLFLIFVQAYVRRSERTVYKAISRIIPMKYILS